MAKTTFKIVAESIHITGINRLFQNKASVILQNSDVMTKNIKIAIDLCNKLVIILRTLADEKRFSSYIFCKQLHFFIVTLAIRVMMKQEPYTSFEEGLQKFKINLLGNNIIDTMPAKKIMTLIRVTKTKMTPDLINQDQIMGLL